MRFHLTLPAILATILCGNAPSASYGQTEDPQDEMTYFACDFNNGMPEGFTTLDRDGQTLYFSMVQAGFNQGDSWIVKKEERTENYYVASTSKYKYASGEEKKPSDDWLITSPIRIKGSDAVLTWRGNSICSKAANTSGYKVFVSTTGNTPDDFTGEPLFSIEEEAANQWTEHSASLGQYEGKTIYIAFVNDNLDKEILAIDDIKATGTKGHCELTVTTGSHVFGTNEVEVSGKLTAYSQNPVKEFTAYCAWNGKTYTKKVSGLSLNYHESYDFSFDETIPVAYGDTVNYEVWADVDGEAQDKIGRSTVAFVFKPHRKTVIEEGTGMWCVYCPKGIVAMDELARKYPGEFIGLAIHHGDVMEVSHYDKAMYFPGFPSGYINRKYTCKDPMVLVRENGKSVYSTLHGGFESYFLKAQQEQTLADISLQSEVADGKIKIATTCKYAIDQPNAGYQIAFALVEDGVTGPGYYQENGFSGGGDILNGYESLPDRIIPATFDHVAREIYDDYQGVPGSVPTDIKAATDYSFDYTIDVPKTIMSIAKTKVVAMLIDMHTGEIVNADAVPVSTTGINNVTAETMQMTLTQSADGCRVSIATPDMSPVRIVAYDAGGHTISVSTADSHNGNCVKDINLHGSHGLYIITAVQGNRTVAKKLVIR